MQSCLFKFAAGRWLLVCWLPPVFCAAPPSLQESWSHVHFKLSCPTIPLTSRPPLPRRQPLCLGGRPSVRDSPRRHVATHGVFRHAGRQGGGGKVGDAAGVHLVPEGAGGSGYSLVVAGERGWGLYIVSRNVAFVLHVHGMRAYVCIYAARARGSCPCLGLCAPFTA